MLLFINVTFYRTCLNFNLVSTHSKIYSKDVAFFRHMIYSFWREDDNLHVLNNAYRVIFNKFLNNNVIIILL